MRQVVSCAHEGTHDGAVASCHVAIASPPRNDPAALVYFLAEVLGARVESVIVETEASVDPTLLACILDTLARGAYKL